MSHPPEHRIPNPRRLLILSPSSHSPSTIPPFLHALTGSPVEPPSSTPPSFAGYTTHPPLQIRNRYYVAEVPVWVDEIALQSGTGTHTSTDPDPEKQPEAETEPNPPSTPSLWKSEFSGPDAQVVRDAVGAVVLCFLNPSPRAEPAEATQALKDFVRAIGDVRALIEEERGGAGDVPGLVVLVGAQGTSTAATGGGGVGDLEAGLGLDAEELFSVPWWEDQLCEMGMLGMEVVSWDPKAGEVDEEARNQFGGLSLFLPWFGSWELTAG